MLSMLLGLLLFKKRSVGWGSKRVLK